MMAEPLAFNKLYRIPELPSLAPSSTTSLSSTTEASENKSIKESSGPGYLSKLYPKAMLITKKTVNATIDSVTVISGISRAALSLLNSIQGFFKDSSFINSTVSMLKPVFTYINLSQIILAPLHFYSIFHSLYDLFKRDIDLIDCTMNIIRSTGLLIGSVITLLKDLAYIGVIPLKLVAKLWPFDVIGIIVALVNIISSARNWHDSAKFSKEFLEILDTKKELTQFNQDDYLKIANFMLKQDTRKIKRITDIQGQEMIDRVVAICKRSMVQDSNKSSDEERLEAKKEFKEAMIALHGRVKSKITSSKAMLVTNSVKLVASTVMLTSSALAVACPATLVATPFLLGGAMALSGAADIANTGLFVAGIIANKKFNQTHLMQQKLEPTPT